MRNYTLAANCQRFRRTHPQPKEGLLCQVAAKAANNRQDSAEAVGLASSPLLLFHQYHRIKYEVFACGLGMSSETQVFPLANLWIGKGTS